MKVTLKQYNRVLHHKHNYKFKRVKHKKLVKFIYENCIRKVHENLYIIKCPYCSYFHLADDKILRNRVAHMVRHVTSQHAEI